MSGGILKLLAKLDYLLRLKVPKFKFRSDLRNSVVPKITMIIQYFGKILGKLVLVVPIVN